MKGYQAGTLLGIFWFSQLRFFGTFQGIWSTLNQLTFTGSTILLGTVNLALSKLGHRQCQLPKHIQIESLISIYHVNFWLLCKLLGKNIPVNYTMRGRGRTKDHFLSR